MKSNVIGQYTANSANVIPANKNEIPISEVKVPDSQPRRYFDEEKLESLAKSIQAHGVLEPLLVRFKDDKYELIAGERRLRASEIAGLSEVPVIILDLDDIAATQVRLIENLQREDLNPVEETEGILELLSLRLKQKPEEVVKLLQRLEHESKDQVARNVTGSDDHNIIEEVFASTGRMSWKSFLRNRLPLLNLPHDLLKALREGRIEYTKAKEINKLKNEEARIDLLEEAIKDNLSLLDIKQRIKELQQTQDTKSPSLKQQANETFRHLKKSKVWDDEKKTLKLEKLLKQIEELMK
ncbi:MAG: ParB/RepB/Spo0J family partition protein [Richelia sp. RM1_1_1]|nr:ParB/RepB/Spo0J family partition protein [Richelia sp. RM1_1_1]